MSDTLRKIICLIVAVVIVGGALIALAGCATAPPVTVTTSCILPHDLDTPKVVINIPAIDTPLEQFLDFATSLVGKDATDVKDYNDLLGFVHDHCQ